MTKFAKFALPAALAFAAFGAQATELYTLNAVQGGTNAPSLSAAPVNPADVFAPSAVNRFERSVAATTRSSAVTPRDVYAPSLVYQVAGKPVDASAPLMSSAAQTPKSADAAQPSAAGQREIYVGA